ncbi:unnamed protein product [Amaranthus hypochondriacus]
MSRTLNIPFLPNNLQGYGPSDSTSLPCLGVSGRAVSVSTCPRTDCKRAQVKITLPKCSLKHFSLICMASTGGHRRNPDFSRQNSSGYSRNRNRLNEERDNFENLDEPEFLSTKNGPLLSLSNSPKSRASSVRPREREIVDLFRKVQAQLRQRAANKEDKKFESVKGQNKESETVDSLLKLLRKHSVEQGKQKVDGGSVNEFSFDLPRPSGQSNEDKSKDFFDSGGIREEPQETNKPSFSRPPSAFRRRSPVPRVKYEPIISSSDLDVKTYETLSEPGNDPESDSDLGPDMDLVSGLELEQEVEKEEEVEAELAMEADYVDEPTIGKLSETEFYDAEEDEFDKNKANEHAGLNDLSNMKLSELRSLAKARGMKGFSKLKKLELVELLSDDPI